MFLELAERSFMSPLAGTKHTYVTQAIIIHFKMHEKLTECLLAKLHLLNLETTIFYLV